MSCNLAIIDQSQRNIFLTSFPLAFLSFVMKNIFEDDLNKHILALVKLETNFLSKHMLN